MYLNSSGNSVHQNNPQKMTSQGLSGERSLYNLSEHTRCAAIPARIAVFKQTWQSWPLNSLSRSAASDKKSPQEPWNQDGAELAVTCENKLQSLFPLNWLSQDIWSLISGKHYPEVHSSHSCWKRFGNTMFLFTAKPKFHHYLFGRVQTTTAPGFWESLHSVFFKKGHRGG